MVEEPPAQAVPTHELALDPSSGVDPGGSAGPAWSDSLPMEAASILLELDPGSSEDEEEAPPLEKQAEARASKKTCLHPDCTIEIRKTAKAEYCRIHGYGIQCRQEGCLAKANQQLKSDFCKLHDARRMSQPVGCDSTGQVPDQMAEKPPEAELTQELSVLPAGGAKTDGSGGGAITASLSNNAASTRGGSEERKKKPRANKKIAVKVVKKTCLETDCTKEIGKKATTGSLPSEVASIPAVSKERKKTPRREGKIASKVCLQKITVRVAQKTCLHPDCSTLMRKNAKAEYCRTHGRGIQCRQEGCLEKANKRLKSDFCDLHGGATAERKIPGRVCLQKTCLVPDCTHKILARKGTNAEYCRAHGSGIQCRQEGCLAKASQRLKSDFCDLHEARRTSRCIQGKPVVSVVLSGYPQPVGCDSTAKGSNQMADGPPEAEPTQELAIVLASGADFAGNGGAATKGSVPKGAASIPEAEELVKETAQAEARVANRSLAPCDPGWLLVAKKTCFHPDCTAEIRKTVKADYCRAHGNRIQCRQEGCSATAIYDFCVLHRSSQERNRAPRRKRKAATLDTQEEACEAYCETQMESKKTCIYPNCTTEIRINAIAEYCGAHGYGTRCRHEGCLAKACRRQNSGFCSLHGTHQIFSRAGCNATTGQGPGKMTEGPPEAEPTQELAIVPTGGTDPEGSGGAATTGSVQGEPALTPVGSGDRECQEPRVARKAVAVSAPSGPENEGGTERCQHGHCVKKACKGSRFCVAHGEDRICRREGCNKVQQNTTGFCKTHYGGGQRCTHPGCETAAFGSNPRLCKRHGGGTRCTEPGCSKLAMNSKIPFCIGHGGGTPCEYQNTPGMLSCTNAARAPSRLCRAHGGGKRCTHVGCKSSAIDGKLCSRHGGGRRCVVKDCIRAVKSGDYCVAHGGGKRCSVDGCPKSAQGSTGMCINHYKDTLARTASPDGATAMRSTLAMKTCLHPTCTAQIRMAFKAEYCVAHGGGIRCRHQGCSSKARLHMDMCVLHGMGRTCQHDGCDVTVRKMFCKAHGYSSRRKQEKCDGLVTGVVLSCKPCVFQGCTSTLKPGAASDYCANHGYGKQCQCDGCPTKARARTMFCIAHGDGSTNPAQERLLTNLKHDSLSADHEPEVRSHFLRSTKQYVASSKRRVDRDTSLFINELAQF